MRETLVQPIVIMSVFKTDTSMTDNNYNHRMTKALLRNEGMIVQEVIGCYNGHEEKSLMIVNPSELDVLLITKLASDYKQECILSRNKYNECYLIDEDGFKSYIGKLVPASAYAASQRLSWTYNPVLEQHYVTER